MFLKTIFCGENYTHTLWRSECLITMLNPRVRYLTQHSNKAFKFKQRFDFKRYNFLRTRGFSIVIRHSLPTKASFQKVYFFLGHPV